MRTIVLRLGIFSFLSMVSVGRGSAQSVSIEIETTPPFGTLGLLTGSATGVDPATHHVATYIMIDGSGWWSKPHDFALTVPLQADGSFSVDVGTGGASSVDAYATVYCVALLSTTDDPPVAGASRRIPATLDPLALAMDCDERYGRILEFAGRSWAVKESPLPVGPGENRFGRDNAFVDAEGRLHLTITEIDGHWRAAEVVLLDDVGQGTFFFTTEHVIDALDPDVTLGAFTWDVFGDAEHASPFFLDTEADNREIDAAEDSRWGEPSELTNTQVVVQPFNIPSNLQRFTIPPSETTVTRVMSWGETTIEFLGLRGRHASTCDVSSDDLLYEHVYLDNPGMLNLVPPPGREQFHFNLWPNNVELGNGSVPMPASGESVEVVVSNFGFVPGLPEPGECVTTVPALTQPVSGSTLSGATETFVWTANGANVLLYWLYIGSSPGDNDLSNSGALASLSHTANGLPEDGSTLHVRLFSFDGVTWTFADYQYTANGFPVLSD